MYFVSLHIQLIEFGKPLVQNFVLKNCGALRITSFKIKVTLNTFNQGYV